MYKHILVAVDGSEISNLALQEAINITKQHQAKLRIIHVIEEFNIDYVGRDIDYVKLENSYKQYGQKILTEAEQLARESRIDFDVQLVEIKKPHGRVGEKIAEEAKGWPADLLVIGTHGRRGVHHFLLGSVAEELIRISPSAVLVINGKK